MSNMGIQVASWTAVLFVLRVTHISATNIPKYFRHGETLELRPTVVPDQITSIMWRHNDNYVVEWMKDAIALEEFGQFIKRTELDLTTGYLKIRQATKADSGVFTVEINQVLQEETYKAQMIGDVPDPHVWLKPGPNPETYLLYCEPVQDQAAGLEAAKPVSYRWKIATADWVEFGNKVEINVNETTRRVETFTCQMVNPVSNKTSEPEKNPFYEQSQSVGSDSTTIVAVCVSVGLAVLVGGFCFAYKKNKIPFNRTGNVPVSPSGNEHEEKLNPAPAAGSGSA